MGKTILISQSVAEETPAGAMPNITAAPLEGQTYTTKFFLDGEIAPAGTKVFTLPAAFAAFASVLRIYAEEAGKDLSDDYSVTIVTSGPQTILLNPTPNKDKSIMLTIPSRYGLTGTETLTSVTVTDIDGLHADTVKVTFEAVA